MMNHTSALMRLIDIEDIRRLIYRYFRAVDDGDVAGTLSCFTEDARQEWFDGETVIEGLGPMAELVRKHAEARTQQTHLAGNIDVEVNGDTACSEARVLGFRVGDQPAEPAEPAEDSEVPAKGTLRACGSIFSDELLRTPDGWKIWHRRHHSFWQYEVESLDTMAEARAVHAFLGAAAQEGALYSGR